VSLKYTFTNQTTRTHTVAFVVCQIDIIHTNSSTGGGCYFKNARDGGLENVRARFTRPLAFYGRIVKIFSRLLYLPGGAPYILARIYSPTACLLAAVKTKQKLLLLQRHRPNQFRRTLHRTTERWSDRAGYLDRPEAERKTMAPSLRYSRWWRRAVRPVPR